MANQERSIELFIASNAKAPFEEWMRTVRDKASKARIYSRIDRLRLGTSAIVNPSATAFSNYVSILGLAFGSISAP